MMKKLIAMLLALTLMFAMGCKTEEPEVVEPAATPEPTPVVETTPEPEAEATPTPEATEEGPYVYTSRLYGFTVTMPASWRECCIIEEENMQVEFYSAANRYMEIDGEQYNCGKLFSVLIPEDDMKDGNGYVFPNYEVIGQYHGADILVLYPSDVQIADVENEDAVAEFTRMNEELADVVSSITFG